MATIIDPPNSVWPNGLKVDSEGYVTFYPLGTNKVDISTITWPKGDKLASPFVYQDDKLAGFVDTQAITVSENTAVYLPYEHIEVDFSSIQYGTLQIHAPNATVKKAIWADSSSIDIPEAQFKYKGCTTVDNVKAVDANYETTDIVDGTWSEPLWDLEDGSRMFYKSQLSEFTSDLSSLTDGYGMFQNCNNLTSFSSDLSSLTIGEEMFYECSNLTSFNSDLRSLTDGSYMFDSCFKLTSFASNLSSLTDGGNMFNYCKLDAPSVKNIIDTINTVSYTTLTLGIGCDNTTADKDLFAQEAGYDDMASLLAAFQTKNWAIGAQYNGRPTTTYGLRRPTEEILPVFVKLEEAEDHADYTSEDGSKKFRLDWFHETTGSTEGYTQYATLEEAAEALNIKPIERN